MKTLDLFFDAKELAAFVACFGLKTCDLTQIQDEEE